MKQEIRIIDNNEVENLYNDIKSLVEESRNRVYKTVNTGMINLYWNIGKMIVEMQGGNTKAKYGEYLIKELSIRLTNKLGKGFSIPNLNRMRQFYNCFPIGSTLLNRLTCRHTAEIINKYHDVPIIEDERFNEMNREEEWEKLLKRNIEAIDNVVNTYNNEDTIICVTSGVDFSALICYFYGIEPTNDVPCDVPWSQAGDIFPIIFTIGKKMLD